MIPMGTAALIPVEEYLSTSYPDGDREYIDGHVVERNIGERHHARIQSLISAYLLVHYKQFWSAVAARLKVSARRYRIPDVCLYIGEWPGPEAGR
jgi:hypothetical protein